PARGLDHAALDLVRGTVGIDDEPAVGRAPHAREPHFLVDLDLGRDRRIAAAVLVARHAQPDAATAAAFGAAPARAPGAQRRPPRRADRRAPAAAADRATPRGRAAAPGSCRAAECGPG